MNCFSLVAPLVQDQKPGTGMIPTAKPCELGREMSSLIAIQMNDWFRRFSVGAANALGSSWMFIANVLLIGIWFFAGPFFNYSDSWQLIVNTGTTVLTYLAVFLIQNTQNRDAKAIQLKLDELIKGVDGARTHLVNLENLTDEELDRLQSEFTRLRRRNQHSSQREELRSG
ncbi:MAG: low affinity iron permease family protein [Pyrinomonadaceae bacterium]